MIDNKCFRSIGKSFLHTVKDVFVFDWDVIGDFLKEILKFIVRVLLLVGFPIWFPIASIYVRNLSEKELAKLGYKKSAEAIKLENEKVNKVFEK
jgi:hypothetical protein